MKIKGNKITCDSHEDFMKNKRKIWNIIRKQNENPYKRFKPTVNIYSYTLFGTTVFANHYNQVWWQFLLIILLFVLGMIISGVGIAAYEDEEESKKQYKQIKECKHEYGRSDLDTRWKCFKCGHITSTK